MALPGTNLVTPNGVLKTVAEKTIGGELPDDYKIAVVSDKKTLSDHIEKKMSDGKYKTLSLEMVGLMYNLQHGCLKKGDGERLRDVLRELIAMKKDPPDWMRTLGLALAPAIEGDVDDARLNATLK